MMNLRKSKKDFELKLANFIYPNVTETELLFLHQIGINYCYTWLEDDQMNSKTISRLKDLAANYELILNHASSYKLANNPSIILNLPDRDQLIDEYVLFIKELAKSGVFTTSVSWEPMGSISSLGGTCRGAKTRSVYVNEIRNKPLYYQRKYTREEIMKNFIYFMDAVLPYCEELGVHIALHPNDPPLPEFCGVPSLIFNMDCYKEIFERYPSKNLGMEFCVGCWSEGGDDFGDIFEGLEYFVKHQRLFILHFKNFDSPFPYCKETFLNNGYQNMSRIMHTIMEIEYSGLIIYDQSPQLPSVSLRNGLETGYCVGYLQGLHDTISYA